MKQTTALNILKTGDNVFLTGSAGSGKTYTLNQYIHYLRARKVPVATTASTGIAATHMNGTTIHSWSGIGIKDELSERDLANLSRKQVLKDRLKDTAVLIIDEISMLHAKQLALVDQVLKYVRHSDAPFGGIQLVVAGDFFQLPPVGNRGESNRDKFAFMSPAWLEANLKICYLSEQHRQQTDGEAQNTITLDAILNQIRGENGVSVEAVAALTNTFHQNVDINRTRLYTHNVNVNTINEKELAQLTGETVIYNAIAHGDHKLVDSLKKTVRTNDELTLKVGAKVMFIKNNNELGVSNGTMGELIGFTSIKSATSKRSDGEKPSVIINHANEADASSLASKHSRAEKVQTAELGGKSGAKLGNKSGDKSGDKSDIEFKASVAARYPLVKLNTGRQVIVEPEEWIIEGETGDLLASYSQIPLGLAWAITIHKSQGMTLDAAEIDLSQTFELGQGYVALSRLQSLEGLKLLGMNDMSLRLDPLARGADARFQNLSNDAEQTYQALDAEQLDERHKGFVLKAGGTLNDTLIKAFEAQYKSRQIKQASEHAKKDKLSNQLSDHSDSTLITTRLLLEESLSIAEIAQSRGLAQATIMGHIGKLMRQDPTFKCAHLRPDAAILTKVSAAVAKLIASGDPDHFSESHETDASSQSFSKERIKLRPIYEVLKEQIDYNTIRLALMFID